ncbi:hypothetical protein [Specibacter sp. NPDC078709]|uniref:hypothetical protein n=1 Tax=Specibacter sp. NPDC078709 TaxID=3154364 RepID=UPI00341FE36A
MPQETVVRTVAGHTAADSAVAVRTVVAAEHIDRAAVRTAAPAVAARTVVVVRMVVVVDPGLDTVLVGSSHHAAALAPDRGLLPIRNRAGLATAAALTYEDSIHLRNPDRQRHGASLTLPIFLRDGEPCPS